jgi:hypothetical protein
MICEACYIVAPLTSLPDLTPSDLFLLPQTKKAPYKKREFWKSQRSKCDIRITVLGVLQQMNSPPEMTTLMEINHIIYCPPHPQKISP